LDLSELTLEHPDLSAELFGLQRFVLTTRREVSVVFPPVETNLPCFIE